MASSEPIAQPHHTRPASSTAIEAMYDSVATCGTLIRLVVAPTTWTTAPSDVAAHRLRSGASAAAVT